jgi:hypothetical protein
MSAGELTPADVLRRCLAPRGTPLRTAARSNRAPSSCTQRVLTLNSAPIRDEGSLRRAHSRGFESEDRSASSIA